MYKVKPVREFTAEHYQRRFQRLVEYIFQTAGQYAVLRFKGPYQHLHKAYQWLFGDWLPQSGYLPANTPVMEVYLNNPRQVPASELLTDICLALEVQ